MNKEETMSIEDLFKERNEQGKRIEQLVLENEKLIGLCDKYEEEHKTTFKIWKKDIKENKKLKQQIEYLKNNEYLNQVKWERDYNEKLVEDLNNRIDKVIEYLEEPNRDNFDYCKAYMIQILQGDNNE